MVPDIHSLDDNRETEHQLSSIRNELDESWTSTTTMSTSPRLVSCLSNEAKRHDDPTNGTPSNNVATPSPAEGGTYLQPLYGRSSGPGAAAHLGGYPRCWCSDPGTMGAMGTMGTMGSQAAGNQALAPLSELTHAPYCTQPRPLPYQSASSVSTQNFGFPTPVFDAAYVQALYNAFWPYGSGPWYGQVPYSHAYAAPGASDYYFNTLPSYGGNPGALHDWNYSDFSRPELLQISDRDTATESLKADKYLSPATTAIDIVPSTKNGTGDKDGSKVSDEDKENGVNGHSDPLLEKVDELIGGAFEGAFRRRFNLSVDKSYDSQGIIVKCIEYQDCDEEDDVRIVYDDNEVAGRRFVGKDRELLFSGRWRVQPRLNEGLLP